MAIPWMVSGLQARWVASAASPPSSKETGIGFKLVPAAAACAIGPVIWFGIPVPPGVAPNAWHLPALFVATIAAIIVKAMPSGALSILAIALVPLTGVTSDQPVEAINDALSRGEKIMLGVFVLLLPWAGVPMMIFGSASGA